MSSPRFDALLAVQDLDIRIGQARHRRATLPERSELAAMDADRERLTVQGAGARSARDEIVARQSAMENELGAAEQRSKQVSRRMYSGEISAARELQAMAADVESLDARASDLEDRILALLEEREPLDAAADALEEELTALGERHQAVTAALGVAEAAIDEELADLIAERTRAAAGIPADLMEAYERIRSRQSGVGAARLVGSRCDGCHLSLPATEVDRIRHLPADALVTCDQCGRILVRP
ncbi:MAG: zinc ribbon domain-containing protein [Acidimicrobiales bacterium]